MSTSDLSYSVRNAYMNAYTSASTNNWRYNTGCSTAPLVAVSGSWDFPRIQRTACQHCGQYGEPRSECDHCGAPID